MTYANLFLRAEDIIIHILLLEITNFLVHGETSFEMALQIIICKASGYIPSKNVRRREEKVLYFSRKSCYNILAKLMGL